MLTTEEMEYLLPEMVLVAGIILAVLVPNLGDSTFRIPLTRTRIPIFIGGTRFKTTSNPRIPARIAILAFFVAFVYSFLEIKTASGEVGGVIEITSFTRMMSFVFYGALLLAAIATTYRMPARPSARAPREKDSELRTEALISALMDNRRQVDFHILLLMSGLGMAIVALAQDLFMLFLGLELASLATYVLVAFHKESKAGTEGGVKYFIVGAVASA
ncbi:MAG: proton-conducting transporter membrane subunit, partial [Candidatus Thermoplasmatota archaeon]|nr:proton-conducting transporter membrane subunit [Candidatus Thermoplasmatota archaeon]